MSNNIFPQTDSKTVRVAAWNVRRKINVAEEYLRNNLEDFSIDVLFLLEVDIEQYKASCNISLPGYQVMEKWVVRDYGGVKNSAICRIIGLIKTDTFSRVERLAASEGDRSEIWVRCTRKGGECFTIAGVYNEWSDIEGTRRPGPNMEALKSEIARHSNRGLLMCGDWNIRIDDVLNCQKSYAHFNMGEDFHDHLVGHGFEIHSVGGTHRMTRINKNGTETKIYTSLDWVFTNLPTVYTRKKWIPFSTDHALVYADVKVRETNRKDYELRRDTRGLYSEECLAYLDSVDWSTYYGDDKHVDDLVNMLQEQLEYVMRVFSPYKLVRKRSTCTRPSEGDRAKKNKISFLTRAGRVQEASRLQRELTKERRRKSFKKIKDDLQEGRTDIFSLYSRFTKKEWQSTGVRDRKGAVRGGKEAADIFAETFENKLRTLKKRVKVDTEAMDHLKPWEAWDKTGRHNTFRFTPVSLGKVRKVMKKMKPSTSEDINGLPQKVLKFWSKSPVGIINPLWCIINRSMSSGVFPRGWKSAKLTFLYKGSGDRLDALNYRPLSILNPAGKALEVCATEQFTQFLEVNELLPRSQHGFRKGRSTVTAITDVMSWMDEQKRDKKCRALLAFDFSSAFDMIDHKALNKKLQHLGADTNAQEWFTSFMSERSMAVSVEGQLSRTFTLETCAPQGSPLSPILYLACCYDIGTYIEQLQGNKSVMYADDTSVAIAHKNPEDVIRGMEDACRSMNKYSSQNGLALNIKKTVWMAMDNIKSDRINVDGQEILESKQMRFLGFHVSRDWSGNTHLNTIKRKVLHRISIIRRLSKYMPASTLLKCTTAYVLPVLEYGLEVWSDITNPHRLHVLKKAEVLAKDAARASLSLRRADMTPSEVLWSRLGLQKTRLRALEKTFLAGYDLFTVGVPKMGRKGEGTIQAGRWAWLNQNRNYFVAERTRRDITEGGQIAAQCIRGGESLRNKAMAVWKLVVDNEDLSETRTKSEFKKKLKKPGTLEGLLVQLHS